MKLSAPLLLLTICSLSTNASAQCTKDIECKGDRICVKGACTNPGDAETRAAPKKTRPDTVHELEGTFTSIEFGDYAHWNMRVGGKDRSFFVVRPDASVENVVQNSKKFIGKKCRIHWKTTVQNIPEAGGEMEMDEVLTVKWLEK